MSKPVRIALSLKALQMVGRIPNWPEPDAVQTDVDTGTTVLSLNDPGAVEKINAARFAAANNQKFLLQLARETAGPESLAPKMRRWEMWLRNGMLSAKEAGKLQ